MHSHGNESFSNSLVMVPTLASQEVRPRKSELTLIPERLCTHPAFSQSYSYCWKSTSEELQRCSGSPPKVLVIQGHHVPLKLRNALYKTILCTGATSCTWLSKTYLFGKLERHWSFFPGFWNLVIIYCFIYYTDVLSIDES